MLFLVLAAAASASATTIPSQFVGRWESKASYCREAMDDKVDASFVVVEPKKIWTFEAEDDVKGTHLMSPRELIADVVFSSEGESTPDKAKLTLIAPNRLSVRFAKDWSLATYVRCPKSK